MNFGKCIQEYSRIPSKANVYSTLLNEIQNFKFLSRWGSFWIKSFEFETSEFEAINLPNTLISAKEALCHLWVVNHLRWSIGSIVLTQYYWQSYWWAITNIGCWSVSVREALRITLERFSLKISENNRLVSIHYINSTSTPSNDSSSLRSLFSILLGTSATCYWETCISLTMMIQFNLFLFASCFHIDASDGALWSSKFELHILFIRELY